MWLYASSPSPPAGASRHIEGPGRKKARQAKESEASKRKRSKESGRFFVKKLRKKLLSVSRPFLNPVMAAKAAIHALLTFVWAPPNPAAPRAKVFCAAFFQKSGFLLIRI